MAVNVELLPDRARGPGFAVLRVQGMPPANGATSIAIQRNQGSERHLGPGGWQAVQYAFEMQGRSEDGAALFQLGPELVDPIVDSLAMCQFRVTVGDADGGVAVLRVGNRSAVLGSSARGAGVPMPDRSGAYAVAPDRPPPVVEQPPEPEPDGEPAPAEPGKPDDDEEIEATSEPVPPLAPPAEPQGPARTGGFGWMVKSALVLAVCAAAAAGYMYYAGIGPFAAAPDGAVAVVPATPAGPAAPPETARGLTDIASVRAFLEARPPVAEVLAAADGLLDGGKPDLALLVYRHAAGQGETRAAAAIARMYDPATFDPKRSPLPKADAETAVYWYEAPAGAGDAVAQRRLGALMLERNPDGPQRDKALDWLGKAAAAGDAEAAALLKKVKP